MTHQIEPASELEEAQRLLISVARSLVERRDKYLVGIVLGQVEQDRRLLAERDAEITRLRAELTDLYKRSERACNAALEDRTAALAKGEVG